MSYSLFGLASLGYILHGLRLNGWAEQSQRMGLDWLLVVTVLNVAGALLYVTRVSHHDLKGYDTLTDLLLPERLSPGTGDLVGASHQVLHILVLLAALAHTLGLLRTYNHVHQNAM